VVADRHPEAGEQVEAEEQTEVRGVDGPVPQQDDGDQEADEGQDERYFAGDRWRTNLGSLVDLYRSRRDAMIEALAEHFPEGSTWTHPNGGFYVWVTLPRYVDTQALLAAAVERRVAYVPGTAFYPDGRGKDQVRLAFCYPPEDRIREGVARLGSLLADEEQLYRSLHP